MALKFLNKKGWHTGSLRNIENVWKAEQKHDAEQKKLEELRKQILEERERSEFRLLQEQAGLVPKQERLDFLYDSGLSVGKGSGSDGFKALESFPKNDSQTTSSSSSTKQQQLSVPGALFEEKPQSANDAWRKLHSDPLLLIRQREQEALARVKNNPVQMAMIRKSVEANKEKTSKSDKSREKHHHKKLKHRGHLPSESNSDSDNVAGEGGKRRNHKSSKHDEHLGKLPPISERESKDRNRNRGGNDVMYKEQPYRALSSSAIGNGESHHGIKRKHDKSQGGNYYSEVRMEDSEYVGKGRERHKSHQKCRNTPFKLSEEERAARLQEMQMDAELHEQRRLKRLKKADENDAQEAVGVHTSSSRNFLDAAQKSVFGAEKGGSSTIEESLRRRTHYSQRRSEDGEANAFRR